MEYYTGHYYGTWRSLDREANPACNRTKVFGEINGFLPEFER